MKHFTTLFLLITVSICILHTISYSQRNNNNIEISITKATSNLITTKNDSSKILTINNNAPIIKSAIWKPSEIVNGSTSTLLVVVENNPTSVTVKLNKFPGFSKMEPLAFVGKNTWRYKGRNLKADAGTYNTKITAKNNEGSDNYKTKLEIVEAFFSANLIENHYYLTVEFTDLSSGNPDSWLWDFGDGNSSTEQNPTNMFGNVGYYNVKLTVTYPNGDVSTVVVNIEI